MGTINTGDPIDVKLLRSLAQGRLLNSHKFFDSTGRAFSAAWGTGYTTPVISKRASSDIEIFWRMPQRNDTSGWGGCYTGIEYSEDGTNWISLGNTGYISPTMTSGGDTIEADSCSHFLQGLTGTQIQFRFTHRTYDGTVTINTSGGQSGEFVSMFIIKEFSGYGEV